LANFYGKSACVWLPCAKVPRIQNQATAAKNM